MGKLETAYEDIIRYPKKIISHHLPENITLNLGTVHYHKGVESDNLLMMSYYTSFFNDTNGLNPQLNE